MKNLNIKSALFIFALVATIVMFVCAFLMDSGEAFLVSGLFLTLLAIYLVLDNQQPKTMKPMRTIENFVTDLSHEIGNLNPRNLTENQALIIIELSDSEMKAVADMVGHRHFADLLAQAILLTGLTPSRPNLLQRVIIFVNEQAAEIHPGLEARVMLWFVLIVIGLGATSILIGLIFGATNAVLW